MSRRSGLRKARNGSYNRKSLGIINIFPILIIALSCLLIVMSSTLRKHLSAPGLLKTVRQSFTGIADHRQSGSLEIPLADALMSGLAIFALKYPSLEKGTLPFSGKGDASLFRRSPIFSPYASNRTHRFRGTATPHHATRQSAGGRVFRGCGSLDVFRNVDRILRAP